MPKHKKASVFVKENKKFLTITKTLAKYILEFIMAVKSFMIQTPGEIKWLEKFIKMITSNFEKIWL
jgi:hypothetical protein